MGCIRGESYRCKFTCLADANNIAALTVMKTDTMTPVEVSLEQDTPYTARGKALIDTLTDFAGLYACYITLGNGSQVKSDDIRVEKVDKAVNIEKTELKLLYPGKAEASCTVSGSDPQVILSWVTNDAPIQVDGTTVLSITTNITSDSDPLTIVTMTVDHVLARGRSVNCIAKNLASEDSRIFYT